MRLIKIILHNFRQYKHQEILFPQQGLIGVLGKNGAGKSTLFNALGWCLYGKIKDVNKDMILNMTATKNESCYVELFFEFQGAKYHAKRDTRKTNECFLKTADGTPYAIGTSNLSSFVEENLFKMDYNAFCACYYAEQDDFDNLVKLTPAKRVGTISKLLRIDDIDRAAENTRKEYRGFKTEVDEAKKHLKDEAVLVQQKTDFQQKIVLTQQTIEQKNQEYQTSEEQYKNLLVKRADGEKDYETYKNLLNTSKNAHDQIETLRMSSLRQKESDLEKLLKDQTRLAEIAKYKTVFPTLEQQKDEMTEARSDYREKVSLEKEKHALQTEVKTYVAEFNTLKEKATSFGNVEEQIQEKETQLSSLEETINALKLQHGENNFTIKSKMESISKLKETKTKFDKLGMESPCPECERPLGEHYEERMEHIKQEANNVIAEVKQVQEANKTLEVHVKEQGEQYKQIKQEIKTLSATRDEKKAVMTRVSVIKGEVDIRKEKYNNVVARFEKVKDVMFDEGAFQELLQKLEKAKKLYYQIIELETGVANIPNLQQSITEDKERIASLQATIQQAKDQVEALQFDEELYRQLNGQIQSIQEKMDALKQEQTQLHYHIKECTREIELIDEKMKENEQMKKAIKEKEEQMVLLGKLDEAFKQFKTDILAKLAPTLSEIMSEDIEVMTNGKYNQVELDDEYNIYIYRNGEKRPLSFFSGGEKKLAALCQRLAITGLLVNQTGQASFDMLAMDEVFGAMDNERQDSVVDMLRNLNQKFPQILIVTHSEHVKESFEHVLEIRQDKDGNSTFKWVTDWDQDDVCAIMEEFEDLEEAS